MKRKKLQSQRSKKKARQEDSELGEYLLHYGIKLGEERHSTVAETEHIVRELSLKLLDSDEKEKFFVILQDHIDDMESLKVAMLPLVKEDSTSHFNSESLMRLLLKVPALSDPITELLLEKLPIVTEDKNCNLAALIVSQLRWMTSLSSDVIITKLNQVLPVCPLPVQKEMISGLPELLSDDRHDDACSLLLDQISTIDLVPGILEALSELSLNPEMLDTVYSSVEGLLSALSADSVPSALRFLLSTSEPEKAISSIRENIQFESLCQSGEGIEAEQLSMECLEQILRFHSKTQKCWLSELHRSKELSVFDMLVYLILYRVNSKPKTVLASLKHHVKEDSLGDVQELFQKHGKTAGLFTPELLRISHNLLLSFPDHPVTSLLYRSIFEHGDLHAKQEVVGALISHIGSGQSREINSGIKCLALIKASTDTALDQFSSLLNGLLDYLNTLSIAQAREVLFLLVRISCSGSSRTLDDIHIITTKYLGHSNLKLRKLGVVASCALIQTQSAESSDKTQQFIKKVVDSLESSAPLLALFYDELAACIANKTVNKDVVSVLYDRFLELFQNTYITDEKPAGELAEDQAGDMLCLEGADTLEAESYVCINLWSVVEPSNSRSLVVLFPLLRFVGACVAFLNNNDMDKIDSILGCYIRCLALDDIPESRVATTGLLALVNLVIELINTFHIATRGYLRNKVVQRVKLLYELLGMLKRVPLSDNMVSMVFDFPEDIGGSKNKKGQSSKSVAGGAASLDKTADETSRDDSSRDVFSFYPNKDGTPAGTSTQLNTTDGAAASTAAVTTHKALKSSKHLSSLSGVNKFKGFIRELDLSTLTILSYNQPQSDSPETPATEEPIPCLNLPETCMLLEDLLVKCKFKLKPPSAFAKPDSSVGFSRISTIVDAKFVDQILELLPSLCRLMEDNVTELKGTQITSQTESIMNSTADEIAMMEENPFKVKIFELIFSSLELLFSWAGFLSDTRVSSQCFSILGARLQSGTQGPLSVRRKHALQYLLNFRASCQSFSSTMGLLKCCSVISSSKDQRLADICKDCLQKEWEITADEKENKVRYNEAIGYMVQLFLRHSSENADALLDLLVEELNIALKGKKEEQDKMFPTFTRATLPTIYKIAFTHLIAYQQTISSDKENGFSILETSVGHFSTLIGYIKTVNARPVIRAALLYGQKYLEQFLSLGMPLLGDMMQDNHKDVQCLLRKIQSSTRPLHHMTCHSKSSKDIALIARVPLLKKFLEAFVLKVKALITAKGCTEAFTIGNLKQRNLKGEEIVSQQVVEEEEEEGEDDISELSIDTDEEGEEETDASRTDEHSDSMSIGY